MKFKKEMIEQAKELKSVEELISFAKENGEELTKEQAEEYFAKLHKAGELADDELDNVSGGCGERPESEEEKQARLKREWFGAVTNYHAYCPYCCKVTVVGDDGWGGHVRCGDCGNIWDKE